MWWFFLVPFSFLFLFLIVLFQLSWIFKKQCWTCLWMTCSLWKPDASCTRILVSDFSLMRSSLILKLQLFQLPNLLLSWFQDGRTQKFFCGFHVWNGGIIVYWENIHKPKPVWTQFRLCYDQKATYNASHSFGERRKMKLWVEPVFIQLRFSLGESFLVFKVIWCNS